LFFRTWRAEDLQLAIALWGDGRVTEFIGGPFSEAQVHARLDAEIDLQQRHGLQYWPIFLKGNGEHVGCCGLRPRDVEKGVLEIGFHLRPEHWGEGLATEAARSAMEFAFETLGARELFAGHHPENAASKRAVEKLGMRYSHAELYPPTGLLHPSYILTADDYRRGLLRGNR
jgi:RimJ/RimL family protein N-acetyltransferase